MRDQRGGMTAPDTCEWRIRRALPNEAACLSELALRSKASRNYSREFIAACRDELTVEDSYLRKYPTFVIEVEGVVTGFYSLGYLSREKIALGFLFVEPGVIGKGYGRKLLEHAKRHARVLGYTTMVIESDPHATRFYRAAGGTLVGYTESPSIPGRKLSVFQIVLHHTSCRDQAVFK